MASPASTGQTHEDSESAAVPASFLPAATVGPSSICASSQNPVLNPASSPSSRAPEPFSNINENAAAVVHEVTVETVHERMRYAMSLLNTPANFLVPPSPTTSSIDGDVEGIEDAPPPYTRAVEGCVVADEPLPDYTAPGAPIMSNLPAPDPSPRVLPAASQNLNKELTLAPALAMLQLPVFSEPDQIRRGGDRGAVLTTNSFHIHALTVSEDQRVKFHQLPGNEVYDLECVRATSAQSVMRPCVPILASNTLFYVPRDALSESTYANTIIEEGLRRRIVAQTKLEPGVFRIFVDILWSPHPMSGTEPELNLVKLVGAALIISDWSLVEQMDKVRTIIDRYIAVRIFNHNPWKSDPTHTLDHNYFVFRSEELYRAWLLIRNTPGMAAFLSERQIIELYILTVPDEMWPALMANFDDRFFTYVNQGLAQRAVLPWEDYEDMRRQCYEWAGYSYPGPASSAAWV